MTVGRIVEGGKWRTMDKMDEKVKEVKRTNSSWHFDCDNVSSLFCVSTCLCKISF